MAHAGQRISGPNGFELVLVSTAEETGGELLAMEVSWGGTGGMPPVHHHPAQAERFEMLEGTLLTVVGDVERSYRAGETFDVPAGTPHQMAGDGPARARWEVRPALRTAEFFERLYGGEIDSAEAGTALLAEYAPEFRLGPPD